MVKNKGQKGKVKKTKTKSKKIKTRAKKDTTISVEIKSNKQLNLSKVETDDLVEKRNKLISEFMSNAKKHQEYSDKLEEIDRKMNVILSEILTLESKYSTIDEFIKNNNWKIEDSNNQNDEMKTESSIDEK